ncbi:thioester reductase domain-containing protein [Actinomadura kijaniata]|uniref:thioester reductase domain-containing protein n=1 Tax=Actinomadura kijaniata TaxID=46161 RepID=UPI000B00BD05|nr:thioester reductase domain-containing protein [Actinomadura kijaniata]
MTDSTVDEAGSGPPARGTDRGREAELIERRGGDGSGAADLLARFRERSARDAPPVTGAGSWDLERLAAAIAERAGRFLRGARVDADTDLFDAGATSVDAVELIAVLARELGVRISLDDVFLDGRPRRLAQLWLTREAPAPTAAPPVPPPATPVPAPDDELGWVKADLARADDLPWVEPPETAEPRRILLTGATGFLGGHLLLDLLRRGDAHVVCLVRAADEREGERRLAEALAGYHLPWSAEVARRVTVLPGDVRRPRLGLDEDRWQALAGEVDAIVSVAAAVDFLRGYPSLRQTNVLGPLTLAELATTGPVKPLHHISSIAVFNETGIAAMDEDSPLGRVDRLFTGYDKTKWASEVALRRAREHGLTVTLMRPGGIGGHTRTGAHNPKDLGSGLLSAFSRFRAVPAFRYINVSPVDWVSQVAAAIVYEPSAWGATYNLTGEPNAFQDVLRDMRLGGMNVPVLGWEEWRSAFLAFMEADPVPELEFLVQILRSPTAVKLCEAALLSPAASGRRTEAFVARHGLPAPVRYGARAQLKTYERLAEGGLARLPDKDDPPFLWFHETMRGVLEDTPCELSLRPSIASMYQLARERRLDVTGEVRCALLHPEPLTVEAGDIWVRPLDGIPHRHGLDHPLLRYRLRLRDAAGRRWWLEGLKTARARRDLWRQSRTLAIQVGREGEPAHLAGEVVVPPDSYVRDQIDGIGVNPALPAPEQRLAKLMWLGWFFAQMGWGLLEPSLRAGAELLDLRRDATRTKEIR